MRGQAVTENESEEVGSLLWSLQEVVQSLEAAEHPEATIGERRLLIARATDLVGIADQFRLLVDDEEVIADLQTLALNNETGSPSRQTVRLIGEVAIRIGISAALGAFIAGPSVALVLHQALGSKVVEAAIGGAVGGLTNELINRVHLVREPADAERLNDALDRIAELEKEFCRLGHRAWEPWAESARGSEHITDRTDRAVADLQEIARRVRDLTLEIQLDREEQAERDERQREHEERERERGLEVER